MEEIGQWRLITPEGHSSPQYLSTSTLKGIFHLDPLSGDLFTTSRLDREALVDELQSKSRNASAEIVTLDALAVRNRHHPQEVNVVRLKVHVHDVNDNDPKFPESLSSHHVDGHALLVKPFFQSHLILRKIKSHFCKKNSNLFQKLSA